MNIYYNVWTEKMRSNALDGRILHILKFSIIFSVSKESQNNYAKKREGIYHNVIRILRIMGLGGVFLFLKFLVFIIYIL